ncbi:MAG: transporter substrate-binding domain-containing protein, partial [Betaproteobacteria bacterium]|nr:transporter substrate-binding domain-containing protein [Betaproteobacteria bacterium]
AQLLRVGVLKDYLPFSVVDAQGRLSGFDVDVTSHLATLMHLRVEFVPDTLKGLTQRLAQGDIQWIGNQLLATPENRRLFDLVQPAYASIQLSVIQHENDSRDFLSLEDLFGQRLGVLALTGTAQQAKGVLGHTVRPYLRIEDALEDLVQGKLDAVLEENLIVDYYIEKMNWPLKVAAPFAAPMKVGLAVRKGDQARNSQLSWAVRLMLKDGSLSPIAHRWFGYDVSRFRVGHSL